MGSSSTCEEEEEVTIHFAKLRGNRRWLSSSRLVSRLCVLLYSSEVGGGDFRWDDVDQDATIEL